MLELIMVIVVLGILAALALPRMDRDIRQEAADNILSAIRYTQHMALIDDVQMRKTGTTFEDTKTFRNSWHRSFWRIGFQGCSDDGIFYQIGSDTDRKGNLETGEEALDPTSGLRMNGVNGQPCEGQIQNNFSPEVFITRKYGISDGNIAFAGGCSNVAQHIAFDNMGRPHTAITNSTTPDYSTVLQEDCRLTFRFDDASFDPFTIVIEKETGYSFIVGQPNS